MCRASKKPKRASRLREFTTKQHKVEKKKKKPAQIVQK